jgi:predicted transcriptional regulator
MSRPAATPCTTDGAPPEAAWAPLAGELRELGHPTRAWLLSYWGDQALASLDVARACGRRVQMIAYHVRALVDAGLLEPAHTRAVRGGPQQTYKLTARGHRLAATLEALRRWGEPDAPTADGSA